MSDPDKNAYIQNPDKFTLMDFFHVLVKHRWLIMISTGLAAVLIFIFALYTAVIPDDSPYNPMSNYYSSTVKVMIQQAEGGLSSKIASGASPLNLLLGGGAGGNQNAILVRSLLRGNSVKDRIIEHFGFIELYGLEETEAPKTGARKRFDKSFEILSSEASGSGIMILSYTSGDPVFAADVLKEIVLVLEERFRQLSLERLNRKKEFIESRLTVAEGNLDEVRNSLVNFQLSHGGIDLSSQAKEQARLIADMSSDLIKKELELETLKEYMGENNARVVRLRNEIQKKRKLIKDLRTGQGDLPSEFIPQNRIPSLTNRYLELQGELKVQESIYSMLREQYELVKIDIHDNSRVLQIIDPAEVPELKAGPSRGMLCLTVTAAVFFLAVFWAFVKEYIESKKKDPRESRKMASMRSMLRFRKRKEQ